MFSFCAVLRTSFSLVAFAGLAAMGLLHAIVHAQTPPATAPKPAASAAQPVKAVTAVDPSAVSRPTWSELNSRQQESLKPLAANWNGISEAQKRKWLELSKNYPNLAPADQAVMHSRMNEWVALSPQQRSAARLNFAKTKELSKELTPDEKKAKWQTYQALSPEEKAKLAANATPKPAGAATAVKPVEAQKLAVTPKGQPLLPIAPVAPVTPRATPTPVPPAGNLQNAVAPQPVK